MRTWEFDDIRAVPTNLVLEQDFILRVRRLLRLATPHMVANLCLSEISADYHGRGKLDEVQHRIEELAAKQGCSYALMTNGDVFLTWPGASYSQEQLDQVLVAALPHGFREEDCEKYLKLYSLPEAYGELRERATYYVERSKACSVYDERNSSACLLKSEAARGPLTAWSVNQLENLAKEIDFRPYLCSQGVYEKGAGGDWRLLFDETFMGLGKIKQAYFPHLDINQPQHLFLEFCQILDRALLSFLTPHFESEDDLSLSLNLTLPSVLGREFAQFTHRIPHDKRHKICFEIHCGDLLQNFAQTLSAFSTLRDEGFKIAIDGITPDMMSYLHWERFVVDYYKINVSKDIAETFSNADFLAAIKSIPSEKLVLFHCDSEAALTLANQLGVNKLQGWLVDEKVRACSGPC